MCAHTGVPLFGDGICLAPRFGGYFSEVDCSAGCWVPAKGAEERSGGGGGTGGGHTSYLVINYRNSSSSACKPPNVGSTRGTVLPPPGGLRFAVSVCPPNLCPAPRGAPPRAVFPPPELCSPPRAVFPPKVHTEDGSAGGSRRGGVEGKSLTNKHRNE